MTERRRLAAYLAGLGYGSRREMEAIIRQGRVTGESADLRIDGEPVDPGPGMVIVMNKPAGYTCSHADQGQLVYDLLPARFLKRDPRLSSVGRLDAQTTGVLLLTDDGKLLHRLISPRSEVAKVYEAVLARPLRGDEPALFASGTLMLRSETRPCLPARLEITGPCSARLTLIEGRYHQVRRMFAATGNHVETLHRSQYGPIRLSQLKPGEWRFLHAEEIALF